MDKLPDQDKPTRRGFLQSGALSLAPMALAALAESERPGCSAFASVMPPLQPHFPARARSVIFLFQVGGPSQIDLFDPKPMLNRRDG